VLGDLDRFLILITFNLQRFVPRSDNEVANDLTKWLTISDDLINEPSRTLLSRVFVTVDLLLLERPVGKLLRVCPHRNFSRDMHKSELSGFGLESLSFMSVVDHDLEQGIVMPGVIVFSPSSKLLVRGHGWGCDIMSEKVSLSVHVEQLDNILVAYNTATAGFR